ncbi:MAG: DUF481 domain-containing protein [Candidatus Zixiibacteriota bacterium]
MKLRAKLDILLCTLSFFAVSLPTHGIVNIETLRANVGSGFGGEAELSAAYSSGNTEALDFGYGVGLRHAAPERAFFFLSRGEIRQQASDRYSQKAFGHARFHWRPEHRLSLESFVQIQYDEALRLSSRLVTGAGARLRLGRFETGALFGGLSLMFEREEFQDASGIRPSTEKVARVSSYFSSRLSGSRMSVSSITYFQPRLTELKDNRALNQTTVKARLTEKLALTVNFHLAFDGDPPENVAELDTRTTLGVKLTW